MLDAARILQAEQAKPGPPQHRAIPIDGKDPSQFGIKTGSGVRLFWVAVPIGNPTPERGLQDP